MTKEIKKINSRYINLVWLKNVNNLDREGKMDND